MFAGLQETLVEKTADDEDERVSAEVETKVEGGEGDGEMGEGGDESEGEEEGDSEDDENTDKTTQRILGIMADFIDGEVQPQHSPLLLPSHPPTDCL